MGPAVFAITVAVLSVSAVSERQDSSHLPTAFPTQPTAGSERQDSSHLPTVFSTQPTAGSERQDSSHLPTVFSTQPTAGSERQDSSHIPAAFPTQPTTESLSTRTTAADNPASGVHDTVNSTTDVHTLTSSRPDGATGTSNQTIDLEVRWVSDTKVIVQVPRSEMDHPHIDEPSRYNPTTLTVPDHHKVFLTYKLRAPVGFRLDDVAVYVSNHSQFRAYPLSQRWAYTVSARRIKVSVDQRTNTLSFKFALALSYHKVVLYFLYKCVNVFVVTKAE